MASDPGLALELEEEKQAIPSDVQLPGPSEMGSRQRSSTLESTPTVDESASKRRKPAAMKRGLTELTLSTQTRSGTQTTGQRRESSTPKGSGYKGSTRNGPSFGFKSFRWGASSKRTDVKKKRKKGKSKFSLLPSKKKVRHKSAQVSASSRSSIGSGASKASVVGFKSKGEASPVRSAGSPSISLSDSSQNPRTVLHDTQSHSVSMDSSARSSDVGISLLRPHVAKKHSKWVMSESKLRRLSQLEILRSMKKHVLRAVTNAAGDDRSMLVCVWVSISDLSDLEEINRELNEVWKLEYSILKETLNKETVVKDSTKLENEAVATLKKFTKTGAVSFEDEDLQEAAKYILDGFFDHRTVITRNEEQEDEARHLPRLDDEQAERKPIEILRRAANRVLVTAILLKKTSKAVGSEISATPVLNKSLERLGMWNWSPFELLDYAPTKNCLMTVSVYRMLTNLGLVRALELSPRKVWSFLSDVEAGYNPVPYHNSMHAADVSNCIYSVLQSDFMMCHMSKLDQFAAIISAAVHDLGHDGFNNVFHQSMMTDRALTYNDSSILENYHISKCFFLLKRKGNNWFAKLSRPVKLYLRNAMIAMVLATDMHFHFREVTRLQQLHSLLDKAKDAADAAAMHPGLGTVISTDSLLSLTSMPASPEMESLPGSRIGSISGGPLGGGPAIRPAMTQSATDLTDEPESMSRSGMSLGAMSLSGLGIAPDISTASEISPITGSSIGHTRFARVPLQKTKAIHARLSSALPTDETTKTVTKFEVLEDKAKPRVEGVDDEVTFMLAAAIHLCDISNPAKEIKVSDQWADRVMQEWFIQGDLERKYGLPISPMMNRATASKPSGQIGFIKFIVSPLFDVFGSIVPEVREHMDQLTSNTEHWEFMRVATKTVRAEKRASLKKGHQRSISDLSRRIEKRTSVASPTTANQDPKDEPGYDAAVGDAPQPSPLVGSATKD